jgi:hypothetical protein
LVKISQIAGRRSLMSDATCVSGGTLSDGGIPEALPEVGPHALAVCHLLDALSRELVEHPDGLPEPVRRAAVRLAEQLDRADRAECGERALPVPRQAPDRNVDVMGLG